MTSPTVALDASAILAYLRSEPGASSVWDMMSRSIVSSVNLSEVIAKLAEEGMEEVEIRRTINRLPILVAPFDEESAYVAGSLRPLTKSEGLSFGDRACLALGITMDLPVITADRNWARVSIDLDIRLIR